MTSFRDVPDVDPRQAVLVTCEHGGNRVPAAYAHRFEGLDALLESHRGFDPGALATARALARRFGAPLLASTVTRLLVDLNREVGHPNVFSEATRNLDRRERRRLLERFHAPYRGRVMDKVHRLLETSPRVVHISSHSFTPVLDGRTRTLDVGLLYDPDREFELEFCELWRRFLRREQPDLAVHRNRPYSGISDGLTRTLRRQLPGDRYLGIELEVNQAFVGRRDALRRLRRALATSMRAALDELEPSSPPT